MHAIVPMGKTRRVQLLELACLLTDVGNSLGFRNWVHTCRGINPTCAANNPLAVGKMSLPSDLLYYLAPFVGVLSS
jgi:hypothetical protein